MRKPHALEIFGGHAFFAKGATLFAAVFRSVDCLASINAKVQERSCVAAAKLASRSVALTRCLLELLSDFKMYIDVW